MAGAWLLTFKPTFLTELTALPPKESKQVTEKLEALSQDPTPAPAPGANEPLGPALQAGCAPRRRPNH